MSAADTERRAGLAGGGASPPQPPAPPDGAPRSPERFASWRGRAGDALQGTLVVIGAVVLAFLLLAPLLTLGHFSPVDIYRQLITGAVGSPANIAAGLVSSSPLIFIGLGTAIGMRAGFFNIGGQGQLYFGAVAATWFVLAAGSLPGWLLILGGMAIAFLAGGLWALLAGLAKVLRGSNEVVTTLLLNYVAVGVVDLLIYKPLQDGSAAFPQSRAIPAGAVLPKVDLGGVAVGLDIIIGVGCAVALALLFGWTALGYEIRAMSSSLSASRYAGIRVRRNLLITAFAGGGLAGLAGAFQVMGVQLRLAPDFFSSEVAFTGVLVALLGACRPIPVLIAALLVGALTNGGLVAQQATSAPSVMIYVLEALILLFILAAMQLRSRGGRAGLLGMLSRHRLLGSAARRRAPGTDGDAGSEA